MEITNYVLIDLENVQPKNLVALNGHKFKVLVFVGDRQSKINFDLVDAIQRLASDAEYIKINGNGPNALDFHIAFYIGQISIKDPNSYFHVISKDKGFDPLLAHLKTKKIRAQRHKDVSEIPLIKLSNTTSKQERVEAVIQFLIARGNAKPRKIKTLKNSINSLFMRSIDESDQDALIDELIKRKIVIRTSDASISYKIPEITIES